MRILAFVDIHGSDKALKRIKEKVKKYNPDLMVCAGDITIFGRDIDYIMHKLSKLKVPMVIIPGNHESEKEIKDSASLFKNVYAIHNKSFIFKDVIFLGHGGGGFSLVDRDFAKRAKKFKRLIKKFNKIVLVTHAPPYKTKVDMIMEEHCGNKTIRNFVKTVQPDVAICGHLHEDSGKEDKIGKTKVLNPGPYGKIIKI